MPGLTTFGEADLSPRAFIPPDIEDNTALGNNEQIAHTITDDPLSIIQLEEMPKGEELYGDRLNELTDNTIEVAHDANE